MKNILLKLLLIFSILSFSWINYIWNTYADSWTTVIVTEKIPGAWCEEISEKKTNNKKTEKKVIMYKCTIKWWFASVMVMLWKLIKYFTYIAGLWAVLFIIINWILYSMWGAEPSMKDDAKKRITWTLVWLTLLFLSWVFLNLVAPWIYK